MRIAFFSECYDPYRNGVVVLIKAFRHQLEARGHEVTVIAPEYPEAVRDEPGVVRLSSVNWSRDAYPFLLPCPRFVRTFDWTQFDVLHSHHPFTCSLLAERVAKRFGRPLVYTVHTVLTHYADYLPTPRAVSEPFLLSIVRRHARHADHLTVTTQAMRDWLTANEIHTPASIVPPIHELQPPAAGARERVRAALKLSPTAPMLLYVGRLSWEKNLPLLFDVLARLQAHEALRLVLVGDGPAEDELRELARQKGVLERCLFAGSVPYAQVADYYAAADLFVFPSTSDTFGLVLMEAQSVGLPCVAVDHFGPAEVIEHGVTGRLAADSPVDFAQAVHDLLVDGELRRTMGEAARQRVAERWSADNAERLVAAYQAARQAAAQTRPMHWAA